MTTNRYYAGPPSNHFDGVRFYNPGQPETDRGMADMLRWRFNGQRASWPAQAGSRQVRPAQRVDGTRVTMVGHATFLIQAAGLNMLADPVWSERASPVNWAGPRRVTPPGIAFEHLPPIDIVLLTHNHYDHLDIATLDRLWHLHEPRIIAPLGNDAVVASRAPHIRIETYDWGETVSLGAGNKIHLHPAHHWSARGISDRRMALWCGYIVDTTSSRIYAAGDTGYGDGQIFRDVKHAYGAIDVAVLPIGAYEPRWFMQGQHVNPAEAVQIMHDCGAAYALGVHWGTFQLTDEPRLAPREALYAALAQRGVENDRFLAMEPGDVWQQETASRRRETPGAYGDNVTQLLAPRE